jgi:hypothetical protein
MNRVAGKVAMLAPTRPIHREIAKFLPDDIRNLIVEHLPSDLVRTPVAELPKHFCSSQALASQERHRSQD